MQVCYCCGSGRCCCLLILSWNHIFAHLTGQWKSFWHYILVLISAQESAGAAVVHFHLVFNLIFYRFQMRFRLDEGHLITLLAPIHTIWMIEAVLQPPRNVSLIIFYSLYYITICNISLYSSLHYIYNI